jgi:hypothetical protein
MKFTVNRSKWLRGEPGNSFLLRRADGKMCCLGFLALACGATETDLCNIRSPGETNSVKWPAQMIDGNLQDSLYCSDIMNINDSSLTNDSYKEKTLTEIFNATDIEVTFED